MKNLAFLGTLLVLAAGLFVQACTTRDIVEVVVGSVTVNPQTASLQEGQGLQFSALVRRIRATGRARTLRVELGVPGEPPRFARLRVRP